jgi:hypothetical protein
MKALRALMLVLVLSVCTYADGNMDNGRTGNMDNGKTTITDSVAVTALQLLQSVLPLF